MRRHRHFVCSMIAAARVFVEGGGVTVSRFLEADLLDRLQIAIAPVLIGEGRRRCGSLRRFDYATVADPAIGSSAWAVTCCSIAI